MWNISKIAVVLVLLVPLLADAASGRHHRRHHRKSPLDDLPYKTNLKYICEEGEDDREWFQQKALKKCECPKIYAPVCGSDGVTYHNRCFIQCAVKEKYKGFLRNGKRLTVARMEPCDGDH